MNDYNVVHKSSLELEELLQQSILAPEGLKLVVARLLKPAESSDSESVTLSVSLDSQDLEVEHWKQKCSR